MNTKARSAEIARRVILEFGKQKIFLDYGTIWRVFAGSDRLRPNDAILSIDEQAEEDDYWADTVIQSIMKGH